MAFLHRDLNGDVARSVGLDGRGENYELINYAFPASTSLGRKSSNLLIRI